MSRAGAGHALFAVTLAAIGVVGFIKGDFPPIWEPVAKSVPAREPLVYLCAGLSFGCGLGLVFRRTAAAAARVLLAALLLWFCIFRLPVIVRAPLVEVSWEGGAETLVFVAAAFTLYASLAGAWDRQRFGFATGAGGVAVGRALYGLALIPFGLAHLVYVSQTAELVPGWLPGHVGWAYLTGAAYILAGAAILAGRHARLAAGLSTLQMGLFTFLVWIPILAAGSKDPFQWSEAILSWALTAAGWVVTDSYRTTAGPAASSR
jgi:uncharacterized membrane protein